MSPAQAFLNAPVPVPYVARHRKVKDAGVSVRWPVMASSFCAAMVAFACILAAVTR